MIRLRRTVQRAACARVGLVSLAFVLSCTTEDEPNTNLDPAPPIDGGQDSTQGRHQPGLDAGWANAHVLDAHVYGDGSAPSDAGDAGHEDSGHEAAACTSTFEAIQRSIFRGKGCTAAACHGGAVGALDLRPEHAYASLIHRPARASLTAPMSLVVPGEQALSFLYLKLAAATDPALALPSGGGAPMPSGQPPLSHEQLEAVRLWIRAGAPETGVVAGTQPLLSCDQPSHATPNKSPRPPTPEPQQGFQLVSGPWTVRAGAEDEVCFATYYDLTSLAPDWARSRCTIGGIEQDCVSYDRRQLSQDAQSHHSIISAYAGAVPATDPIWGPWRCAGGALAGTVCDPLQRGAECGEHGVCQATPKSGTCTGFGPGDKETSGSLVSAGGAQTPLSADRFPSGVYAQLPVKGLMLWNSHGFNLTSQPADIEQYNTFWYAEPAARKYPIQGIFSPGNAGIQGSIIHVPPYQTQELCALYTMPRYTRLSELSAHAHKRSLEWRTWLPPQPITCPPTGCQPLSTAPDYRSLSYNDPVVLRFDPPLAFDQADDSARTMQFCSTFDNGKREPSLLKRKSKLIAGSDCISVYDNIERLYCVDGPTPGQPCTSDADCGAGGSCDACAVEWGERTEDEMFFLIGQYYLQPPAP